jgi:hypothetical protein
MAIEACVCTAEHEQKLAMAQAKEARSIMVKEEGEHHRTEVGLFGLALGWGGGTLDAYPCKA